tara:strand:+ start:997 stop:1485 length:489 start_codon:yes stop_codon:yes gene_type:complete
MQIIKINKPKDLKKIQKYNRYIKRKKPIIVKFFSPECPHCVAMEKSWNEVPKIIRNMGYNDRNVDIASVNTDNVDEHYLNGWQNFNQVPTIAKISGDDAKVFDGETDTVSIAHFIIEEYQIPKLRTRKRRRRRIRRTHFGGRRRRLSGRIRRLSGRRTFRKR